MEEGLTSLVNGDYRLTRTDLATLGWETSALILWIRDNSLPSLNNSPFCFTQDMIQCGNCSSNLRIGSECSSCGVIMEVGRYASHTVPVGSLDQDASGKVDPLVKLEDICCSLCDGRFYRNQRSFRCPSCSVKGNNVKITLKERMDEKIGEAFGDEIRGYKFDI